ncbi:leucine-rich repeat-containing protein 31 isoform X1 [Sinocyclocheilus grahami]|uniref:leucine-rich repeat-containing protein 31 isoform X1 n=1 Tax=Sinocyclocheilus grahami TaxID=75366 RepID=UPI0007AC587C|nr:PREDICTED: leucine-rich repeat-containing protein 31 isoform X1 [Sinocyclocheilus grahami]
MDSTVSTKGKESVQKRSPLDLIMNQLRRKASFTERKKPAVGRLFRPSESSDKRNGGIPEVKESEASEGKENNEPGKEINDTDDEAGSVVGWGRVKQFVQKLGKTPHSQNLSLCHCDLTATDVVELATLLPFLAQLEVMDLSWNDLVGGSLKALTVHLQHVGKLRVLKLCSCRLTNQDLTALGEALDCIPLIEVLDLSWNVGVGAGNFRHFTEHLQPESTLKELRLVDCQLSETDITALSEALPMLSSLEELDLSNNKLSIKGMENFTSSLGSTPQLKTLKLSMCGLSKDSISVLGQALGSVPALEHINLSCNKEAGGGLTMLSTNLALLAHLRSLDMHLCCLTKEDVLALVRVASSLKELRELDLSSNKSVGETLQNLLQTLPLSQITKLPLNNCALSTHACHALATAMQMLKQLESLNLSWNKCVGENLKQFLEALPPDCKLQELRLSSCNLTTEDVLQLESACQSGVLSHLKQLDLSYNGSVGDGGWMSLFGKAAPLKGLEELDVSLRPSASLSVSPWLPALLEVLPQLSSLTRLSLQHWALSSAEIEKLEKIIRKKNVILECDRLATSTPKAADIMAACDISKHWTHGHKGCNQKH